MKYNWLSRQAYVKWIAWFLFRYELHVLESWNYLKILVPKHSIFLKTKQCHLRNTVTFLEVPNVVLSNSITQVYSALSTQFASEIRIRAKDTFARPRWDSTSDRIRSVWLPHVTSCPPFLFSVIPNNGLALSSLTVWIEKTKAEMLPKSLSLTLGRQSSTRTCPIAILRGTLKETDRLCEEPFNGNYRLNTCTRYICARMW